MTSIDRLAAKIDGLQRQVAAQGSPQLQLASVVLSDGTEVGVTEAAEAAVQAKTLADVAVESANGKNTVHRSTEAPGATENIPGDVWFQRDLETGVIKAMWFGAGGSAWEPAELNHEVIASLDAGKITVGVLEGDRIAADAFIGKTYATAVDGGRWEMVGGTDSRTLFAYSGLPQESAPGGISNTVQVDDGNGFTGYIGAIALQAPEYSGFEGQAPELKLVSGGTLWSASGDMGGGVYPYIRSTADFVESLVKRGFSAILDPAPEGGRLSQLTLALDSSSETDTMAVLSADRVQVGGGKSDLPQENPRVEMDDAGLTLSSGNGTSKTLSAIGGRIAKILSNQGAGMTADDDAVTMSGGVSYPTTKVAIDATGVSMAASSANSMSISSSDGYLRYSGPGAFFANAVMSIGSAASSAQRYFSVQRLNNQSGGDGVAYEARSYLSSGTKSLWTTVLRKAGAVVGTIELGEDVARITSKSVELASTSGVTLTGPVTTSGSLTVAGSVIAPKMRLVDSGWTGSIKSTTSTAYVPYVGGPEATFVAPPSGTVLVTVNSFMKSGDPAYSCSAGISVRLGSSTGSVVYADTTGINYNTAYVRSSCMVPVDGLVSGQTYHISLEFKTSGASSTATISQSRILVQPST